MRRWGALSLLVFPAFGLVLFREVLLGGHVFFWHDVSAAYMPLRKLAQEAIQAGRLPFWTPQIACGFPVQAEGQAAVFYPLNAIAYLGVPYYHVYSWVIFAQCVLAALGCTLLGRRLGLGWLAASFSGLAFGFSGYFVSKVVFITVLQTGAWLPWLLLCLLAGFESGKWQWFVGASLVLAVSISGGHPQIVFYELLAAVLLLLWLLFARRPLWWRRIGRAIGGGALTVALGAGIAAAQLLPTWALTQFAGSRTAASPALLRSLGLRPHNLAFFLHPYLFGSHGENNYWGQDHYFEVCAYVGGLTLLLAALALFSRRLPLRYRGYWVFLGLFGLFMALAGPNPVYDWLPRVPGFNLFRAPARYLLLPALSLALLAGGAVQALAGAEGRKAGARLAVGAVVALLLCGALMAGLQMGRAAVISTLTRALPRPLGEERAVWDSLAAKAEAKWQFLVERLSLRDPLWAATLGGLGLAAGLGLMTWRRQCPYPLASSMLLVILAGQLYLFGRATNATAPASYYTDLPETARLIRQEVGWGREYGDPAVEWQAFAPPEYAGFLSGDLTPFWEEREVLRRNRAPLYGVSAAHAFYTLLPQRQVTLLEEVVPDGLHGQSSGTQAPLQVLRMLGVRNLIAAPGLHSPWLRVMKQTRRYSLYHVVAPMPSAWLPARVVSCLDGAGALRGLCEAGFRPEEVAYVEGLPPRNPPSLEGAGAVARLLEERADGFTWEVSAPGHAFLVFNFAYNPNWRAEINGRRVTVHRTNYVQAGVIVPPGQSRVELRYVEQEFPLALRITQASSATAGLLLLATSLLSLWLSRRGRRRTPAEEVAPPAGANTPNEEQSPSHS